MDIKFIKRLTDNYRIKGIVGYFWDFELNRPAEDENQSLLPYRTELSQHDYQSIEEVFATIKDLYLQSLLPEEIINKTRKKEREQLESFAEILFGDPFCWEDGTVFAERRIRSEKSKTASIYYPRLSFIYELFHLTVRKNRSRDFVFLLAKNQDAAVAIIREKSVRDLSKEDVYNICEKTILEQFSYETLSWLQFCLMNSVSYFVFGSPNHWIESNRLDGTKLKELFRIREKPSNDSEG